MSSYNSNQNKAAAAEHILEELKHEKGVKEDTQLDVIEGRVATKPSEVVQVLINKSLKPEESKVYGLFAKIMKWADEVRKLRIRTNADKPDQASAAVAFGAEGIGLCRTEHMFFDHIEEMREMILADSPAGRKKALAKLLPHQRQDFYGIFKAMNGHPVTIRTLDPPLHEFLPHDHTGQNAMAEQMGVKPEVIAERVKALHEFNPMLGFRGCRLGIVYPEITEMQARAIIEAACDAAKEGVKVEPEIMIPLVAFPAELKAQAKIVRDTAEAVFKEKGIKVPYLIGTMIELPRACIAAEKIVKDGGAVLQLRHQRPDADGPGHEPGRLRQLHPPLHRAQPGPEGPVPGHRF